MNDCANMGSELNMTSKSIAPRTTVEAKHEELASTVRYLDKFEKDLHEINERLAGIANKINPEDYFGNQKLSAGESTGTDSEKVVPVKRYTDGLVGSMDTHIHQLNSRIVTLQSSITLAFKNLYYLQEQL